MIYHWPRKNPLPKAQKIVVWTGWTSGRVFSWRNISVDFLTNFPGPVVEFFLEEIFLGIFDANFPGPVVDFFLEEIFLRIFDAKFPGPVVRRVFSSRNFSRDFWFEFSWTSGRVFSWIYISEDFDANFEPKMLWNISPSDSVWTRCGGVVVWTGWTGGRVFSWKNSRDFIFKFSWTSGRFFLDEIFLEILYSDFRGPVVDFFSWRNISRDFLFRFSWTSGRVFSWRDILEIFYSNFPGPVVEFFLGEIFVRIFGANFGTKKAQKYFSKWCGVDRVWWCYGVDGVDRWQSFFLKKYFYIGILYSNFPGPVVEFFLEEIFLGILYSDFPGPVVVFFLEEIRLGILYSNFPGPVVEFFLEEIFLGIFDANFPGPVVDFFLEEIFLRIFDAKFPGPVVRRVFSWRNFSRDFWFEFSWTSGRVFSWRYISFSLSLSFSLVLFLSLWGSSMGG